MPSAVRLYAIAVVISLVGQTSPLFAWGAAVTPNSVYQYSGYTAGGYGAYKYGYGTYSTQGGYSPGVPATGGGYRPITATTSITTPAGVFTPNTATNLYPTTGFGGYRGGSLGTTTVGSWTPGVYRSY